MDSVTQSYSVLLVSASAKFMDSVLPLLPERSFSPITKAPDVSSARRCLLERSYDLLIINAPLPDEFGTNFALDICLTFFQVQSFNMKSFAFDLELPFLGQKKDFLFMKGLDILDSRNHAFFPVFEDQSVRLPCGALFHLSASCRSI